MTLKKDSFIKIMTNIILWEVIFKHQNIIPFTCKKNLFKKISKINTKELIDFDFLILILFQMLKKNFLDFINNINFVCI